MRRRSTDARRAPRGTPIGRYCPSGPARWWNTKPTLLKPRSIVHGPSYRFPYQIHRHAGIPPAGLQDVSDAGRVPPRPDVQLSRLEGAGTDPPLHKGAPIMSAREMTWAMLAALPEAQQAAYWKALVGRWQANAERQADADFVFDHSAGRREVAR